MTTISEEEEEEEEEKMSNEDKFVRKRRATVLLARFFKFHNFKKRFVCDLFPESFGAQQEIYIQLKQNNPGNTF